MSAVLAKLMAYLIRTFLPLLPGNASLTVLTISLNQSCVLPFEPLPSIKTQSLFIPYIMKRILVLIFLLSAVHSYGQSKNFIDRPYLETSAQVDTLVVPDRIYLSIILSESDTKDRISVEELENRMQKVLNGMGIDTKKQLFLSDLSTDFKDYFLRKTGVLKSKAFSLLVYDALTAGKVIKSLESEKIANVNFQRAELSNKEDLLLDLRKKAVAKGILQAQALLEPIGKTGGDVLYISDVNTAVRYPWQQRNMRFETMAATDMSQPIDVDFQKVKVESTVSLRIAID